MDRHRILATLGTFFAAAAIGAALPACTLPRSLEMTEDARSYLSDAIRRIRQNAYYSGRVNWNRVEPEAYRKSAGATDTAGTYGAVRYVLDELDDGQSVFLPPEFASAVAASSEGRPETFGFDAVYPEGIVYHVDPNGPAAQAGLETGDRIELVDGQPPQELFGRVFAHPRDESDSVELTVGRNNETRTLTVSASLQARVGSLPEARRLGENLAYLRIPPARSTDQYKRNPDYTQALQSAIAVGAACWMVDLRADTGGSALPTLTGAGSLTGNGTMMGYMLPDGAKAYFRYTNGNLVQASTSGDEVLIDETTPTVLPLTPTVAVLTSRITAAGGEAIALAFRSRINFTSFGEATYGAPSAIQTNILEDGAALLIATAIGLDRADHLYEQPIRPDRPVPVDFAYLDASEDDLTARAARAWLDSQPHCATG